MYIYKQLSEEEQKDFKQNGYYYDNKDESIMITAASFLFAPPELISHRADPVETARSSMVKASCIEKPIQKIKVGFNTFNRPTTNQLFSDALTQLIKSKNPFCVEIFNIKFTKQALTALLEAFNTLPSLKLTTLKINSCELSDEDALLLLEKLSGVASQITLILDNNDITLEVAKQLEIHFPKCSFENNPAALDRLSEQMDLDLSSLKQKLIPDPRKKRSRPTQETKTKEFKEKDKKEEGEQEEEAKVTYKKSREDKSGKDAKITLSDSGILDRTVVSAITKAVFENDKQALEIIAESGVSPEQIASCIIEKENLSKEEKQLLGNVVRSGILAIHLAAYLGKYKIIAFFAEKKVNLNRQDEEYKQTPLHFAVVARQENTILVLLKQKANIFFENAEGFNPFDMVVLKCEKRMLGLFERYFPHIIEQQSNDLFNKLLALDKYPFDPRPAIRLLLEKGCIPRLKHMEKLKQNSYTKESSENQELYDEIDRLSKLKYHSEMTSKRVKTAAQQLLLLQSGNGASSADKATDAEIQGITDDVIDLEIPNLDFSPF